MNVEEIKKQLKLYIDEGNKLKISERQPASEFCPEIINSAIYKKWCNVTYAYLKNIFGDKEQVINYYNIITTTACEFEDGANHLVAILESFYEIGELYLAKEEKRMDNTNKVFIVHGHDELLLAQVNLLLTQLKLEPIVLKNEPNGGLNSIFDKLIQNADVGYAIVLFTPDDVGGKKAEEYNLKTRARQNVVLELGYFAGKLGKDRVCFLNNGVEELPSDISGITYSDGLDWKYKIIDELKVAGYSVSKDDVK